MVKSSTTAKKLIYSDIRRSIIFGHRIPGERLEIDTLTSTYQTSVTPVRDAIQMLSQDGLVTIKPRAGYFVTRITFKELRDLLDMRRILELAAIERASSRITQKQIKELRNVHAGYTGDDDESYNRYTEENRRFHYLIAVASGNQELAEQLGHLHDRLARFMVIRKGGPILEVAHGRIIDALESYDSEACQQALFKDIDTSREAILETILDKNALSVLLD